MFTEADAKRVSNWTMPFGKYKGMKFGEIDDPEYLEWLVKKTDLFNDSTKYKHNKMIREYLEHIVDCIPFSKKEEECILSDSSVVKHVEENNISVEDWIFGCIMKLDELIYSYNEYDELITRENIINDLERSQRYMQEINDIIKYRRPFIKKN